MPLAKFRCPDGANIDIPKCLDKCRLGNRCLTRSTLAVIAQDRPWTGVPHVTQLLNGTMLEYLKISNPYTIDPKSRAFALLGSSHHKLLEVGTRQGVRMVWGVGIGGADVVGEVSGVGKVSGVVGIDLLGGVDEGLKISQELHCRGFLAEIPLNIGWLQGTCDLLELDGEELILTDAKVWGSNRLLHNKPSGIDFHPSRTPPDLIEAQLQLNAYRVMIKQQYRWDIDRLQVQCTVRDGGLSATVRRGVKELMYLLPVGKLPDDIVIEYFQDKAEALKRAIDTSSPPQPCTYEERWGGNRCKAYCEVASFCSEGVKYL